MLRHLYVSNYALIDEVRIDLAPGFTAITGETGSGKSILMGALSLILGDRADARTVKVGADKCVVEATVDLSEFDVHSFFDRHELDHDTETVIRREVMSGGKSRAFINDTPVQLTVLRELATQLVDIHSQHENMLIGDRAFQFEVLDAFSASDVCRRDYRTAFSEYKAAERALADIRLQEAKLRQDLDYHRFQYDELERAHLDELDEASMESELETMNHAETITGVLSGIADLLDEPESGVQSRLHGARNLISRVARFNPELEELANRLNSVSLEIKDVALDTSRLADGIVFNPERMNELNTRQAMMSHLRKKHNVEHVAELITLRNSLEATIQRAENLDDLIFRAESSVQSLFEKIRDRASVLTAARKKGASAMEKEVMVCFKALGLDHAELSVLMTGSASYHEEGGDEVQWMFRANKGGRLEPVKTVASGGEISRVMLAIKAAIVLRKKLPTLILDEIDQGISGEVARKVGALMKSMSGHVQLLVITHLPQIAGLADHHFRVSKLTKGKATMTQIGEVEGEDRVHELAEMLSGKTASKAAVENARELMRFSG